MKFDTQKPKAEVLEGGQVDQLFRGKATVQAQFSAPGEYMLHVVANDYSGTAAAGKCAAGRSAS